MKTKTEYKETFEIVTSIINEWDPYGLIEMGCPKDEFDAEVGDILTRIKEIHTPSDSSRVVSEVFTKYFDDSFTEVDCQDVGFKLYETLRKYGLVKPIVEHSE